MTDSEMWSLRPTSADREHAAAIIAHYAAQGIEISRHKAISAALRIAAEILSNQASMERLQEK